jgi:hypothetical protein
VFIVDRLGIHEDVREIGLDLNRSEAWSTRERDLFAVAVGRIVSQRATAALDALPPSAQDTQEARRRRKELVTLEAAVADEVKRALATGVATEMHSHELTDPGLSRWRVQDAG